MKTKHAVHFSKEERLSIVADYLQSDLSYEEIAQKYGIDKPNTIRTWYSRLHKSQEFATFAPSPSANITETSESMESMTREELEAENARLRKELEWSRLQTKALNTMIDIAEEQGIRIRKKSGAKQ